MSWKKFNSTRKPPELDRRKGLHVSLMPDTHAAFRMMCFKRGISMQEAVEQFAQACIMDDPRAFKMLEEMVQRKKDRTMAKLSSFDAESLFTIIEDESPLK